MVGTAIAASAMARERIPGGGWKFTFVKLGATFLVTRVRESRGSISADVKVLGLNGQVLNSPGRIPLLSPKEKTALANYIAAQTGTEASAWRSAVDVMADETVEAFRNKVAAVVAKPIFNKRLEFLVEPMLPLGEASMLFGPRGTGKGYFLIHVAVAVAYGLDLPNGLRVRNTVPVLYLDYETRYETFQMRLGYVLQSRGLPDSDRIHYMRPTSPMMDNMEYIARYVDENGIGLVIVDSIIPAGGASHEHGDPSGPITSIIGAIYSLGVTGILTNHPSKAEMRRQGPGPSLAYGSGYGENLCRASYEVNPAEANGDDDLTFSVMRNKGNDLPRMRKPWAFRLEGFSRCRVSISAADAMDDHGTSSKMETWQKIAALLESGGGKPMTAREIAEALAMKEDTIYRNLNSHTLVFQGIGEDGSVGRGHEKRWGLRSGRGKLGNSEPP